jgi:hypothetical protein
MTRSFDPEVSLRVAMAKVAKIEMAARRRVESAGDNIPPADKPARKSFNNFTVKERARPYFLQGYNSTEIAALIGCGRGSAVRALASLRAEVSGAPATG